VHCDTQVTAPLGAYLRQYCFPIRYGHVKQLWPIGYYQTVYASEPGSAEMSSAGRAFSVHLAKCHHDLGPGFAGKANNSSSSTKFAKKLECTPACQPIAMIDKV